MRAARPLAALWLACALGAAAIAPAAADDRRTFAALWGDLLRNSSAPGGGDRPRGAAAEAWRDGAAELHSKLLQRFNRSSDGGAAAGDSTRLEEWLAKPLNLTLEALHFAAGGGGAAGGGDGPTPDANATLSQRLAAHLDAAAGEWGQLDVRQVAALAALQGWALTALLKGKQLPGGGGDGAAFPGHGGAAAGGSRPLGAAVPKSVWGGFKGQLCLRLQAFGGPPAQGPAGGAAARPSVVFGADPCAGPGSASAEGMRWGTGASLTLDCTLGATGEGLAAAAAGGGNDTATTALHGRPLHCGLAVATDAGGGAVLSHSLARPLLLPRAINAARIRICNRVAAAAQYPAALHQRSADAVSLLGLRLNGRPLLPAPGLLAATPASAADGCLQQVLRFSHKATDRGFVLSGWVGLGAQDGASPAAGAPPTPEAASGWGLGQPPRPGVGELASVEVALGEWKAPSLLDSAAARLAGGGAGAAAP